MSRSFSLAASKVDPQPNAGDAPSSLAHLDMLGRVPVPLRMPFKAGLDAAVADHARHSGVSLQCRMLGGTEWYLPFDRLAHGAASDLPGMLITTLFQDVLSPGLLRHYAPQRPPTADEQAAYHPACRAAGLPDPSGSFRLWAFVPFVFLVDDRRLNGRAAPTCWADLLAPHWAGEIVFGGWRPHAQAAYQEHNGYLLMCMAQAFGRDGLKALARNVRHLQHNVRTAAIAGSNHPEGTAIAILPWLQASLCPRRERTRVIWPEDGALALPMGYMIKPEAEARLRPLTAYLTSMPLAEMLARNCYPPARCVAHAGLPAGARLRWPGWDWLRHADVGAASQAAKAWFFEALGAQPQAGMERP